MTARGRWRGAPASPTFTPRRQAVAAAIPVESCVTESFDTADTLTIGPDQTWLTRSTGAGAAPRIRGNALTLAGSASGTTKKSHLRCETDSDSADMIVSAVVSAVGAGADFSLQTWGVFARMFETPGDPSDFAAGDLIGWLFTLTYDGSDWTPFLEEAFYNEDFTVFSGIDSAASYQFVDFNPGDPLGPFTAPFPISIQVTGSGDQTRVVCSIDGTDYLDVSGDDLAQGNFHPGSGDPSDQYDRWAMDSNATGPRGGAMLAATSSSTWASGRDDVIRLDDFEVCPA